MCSGAIINARLDRVVYGARDPKAGCAGSVADLFVMPFNHTPVIRSGILEEECAQLLSDFFAGCAAFPPISPEFNGYPHPFDVENSVETVKTMIFYPYFTLGNCFSTLSTAPWWKMVDSFSDKICWKNLVEGKLSFSSCRKYAGIV